MKPSAIRQLLLQLAPAREPVLLVGQPGVGKSDIVTQVAATLDFDLIVTHPVVEDPTDYKGMPAVVSGAGGPTAEFLPFGELSRMLGATKPTLVMMDDLGQAPPAVQAAVMQLVLARRINGHRISDHVSFMAATNRREDKAAVTGLIAPLLDRFTTVLTMEFDLDEWITWGIDHAMPPELLAFARLKPALVNAFEPNKEMKKSPTPRSVAGLGRLVNLGVLEYEALAGAAGQGFATEFLAFYRTWRSLPDRTEIYLNPDTAPVPEGPDVLYALMGCLSFAANPGNFEQTVRYLSRVPAEFSVVCVKDAVARNKGLTNTRAFNEWARDNAAAFSYDAAA
jgi:hypothetical protein